MEGKTGEKLFKLSTVAEAIDATTRTVQKHVREGLLPVVRIGPHRLLRVRQSDFTAYVNAQNVGKADDEN